jgi:hypothetical protein
MQRTFRIDGRTFRTSSACRFVAWIVQRDSDRVDIFKRSNSIESIRTQVRRRGIYPGSYMVVIDTVTGEQIRV